MNITTVSLQLVVVVKVVAEVLITLAVQLIKKYVLNTFVLFVLL